MSQFVFSLARWSSLVLGAALVTSSVAFARDVEYDVNGAPGIKDDDGRPSYTSGSASNGSSGFWGSNGGNGSDGRKGGDAVDAYVGGRLRAKGWDGGQLYLGLAVKDDSVLVITGDKVESEQTAREKLKPRSVPHEAGTSLLLRARGGRGGNGGDGGRGEDGGDGGNGGDATRSTSGGNGGRGGDGGDEGDSTSGKPAGKGGKIVVRVNIRDTDTAMVIDDRDVRGNRGGDPGSGNGPGSGGSGGAGGSSHSWTETRWRTVTNTETDSEGKTTTKTSQESYEEPFSNPGGWSGSDGIDGRKSSKPVSKGADSGAGSFSWEVVDEKGEVTAYEEPYHLELLTGFEIEGSHNGPYLDRKKDFLEPGETGKIRKLRVMNVGKSPTPKYQKFKVFITDNSGWIVSDGLELTVPRVLQPGDVHDFGDEEISFHLREKDRETRGLLRDVDLVSPSARITRLERHVKDFAINAAREIKVQYPIQIRPLQALNSISPGEGQEFSFEIENISQQTIGLGPEYLNSRYARTEFKRTGGSTRNDDYVISASLDGGAVDAREGISRRLEGLKPGEKIVVTLYMAFRDSSVHYTQVEIQPELYLESILDPKLIKLIQYEPYKVRVSKEYEYSKDADVLLVANHGLDSKVFDALRAVAAIKQLKMDIWDFSKYGFFDFNHVIPGYGPVLKAYRGKTVIILGNKIETPDGEVRTQLLISSEQVIEAARRYGVKIVVIDTTADPERTVTRLTEPLPLKQPIDPTMVDDYASKAKYLKWLSRTIQEIQQVRGDETAFLGISRMRVTQVPILPWQKPSEVDLAKAGKDALVDTEARSPESQAYVDYEFNPTVVGRPFYLLGLWRKWDLGSLSIRRSVDDSKTSVVAIKLDPRSLEDPDFIVGDQFQTAFDLALNFETKLKLLDSILNGHYDRNRGSVEMPDEFRHVQAREPMDYARVLVHSLLLDLIHEQMMVRPLEQSTLVPKKELWNKLDLLKQLTHYDYRQFQLNPDSEEGQVFMDLIVSLRFFNRAITTYAERAGWFWPYRSDWERNVEVSQITNDMINRLVDAVFSIPGRRKVILRLKDALLNKGKESAGLVDRLKEAMSATGPDASRTIANLLRAKRGEAREKKVTRDGIMDFLDPLELNKASVRDGQTNRDPAGRVRDRDRQDALLTLEKKRVRKAYSVRGAVETDTIRHRRTREQCEKLFLSADALPKEVINVSPTGIPKIPVRR